MQNNSVKNTKCSLYCNCTFIFLQIAIASKLQGELIRQGLDPFASKVVMDTVPYTSYIRDVHHYNGINKALKSLVTTSSKWHFRLICLAVSLFDTQWVEIILGGEFLFLFTFIFRIFSYLFYSSLNYFEDEYIAHQIQQTIPKLQILNFPEFINIFGEKNQLHINR